MVPELRRRAQEGQEARVLAPLREGRVYGSASSPLVPSFTMVILATYIGGHGPLPPKCLGGKGSHNGHF